MRLCPAKWRDEGTREYHIGPMAQQFNQLFAVGIDDKAISTVDPSGVALAGIQELVKQNNELKKENEELRQRVTKIEQLLSQQQ